MKYFLFICIMLIFTFMIMGCQMVDNVRNSRIDYTEEIFVLKGEKDKLLAEKKKLTDMVTSIIEKTQKGEVTISDAQLLFAEINKTKDKVSGSIGNVNAKIADMKAKAKAKSEETGVPWWAIMIGNVLFTIFGVKNRTKFGLSEHGYKHS